MVGSSSAAPQPRAAGDNGLDGGGESVLRVEGVDAGGEKVQQAPVHVDAIVTVIVKEDQDAIERAPLEPIYAEIKPKLDSSRLASVAKFDPSVPPPGYCRRGVVRRSELCAVGLPTAQMATEKSGPISEQAVVTDVEPEPLGPWWTFIKGASHLEVHSALLGRKRLPYAYNALKNNVAEAFFGGVVNGWRERKYNKAPEYYLPEVVKKLRGKFALRERTPALKDEVRRSILLLLKDHAVNESWVNEVMSGTIYMLLAPAKSEVTACRFLRSSSHAKKMKSLAGEVFGAGLKKGNA